MLETQNVETEAVAMRARSRFGTFIETGAGLIQGSIERVNGMLEEQRGTSLRPWHRAALAVLGIGLSAGLATVGIITLIARGFLAVHVIPVVTLGMWKVRQRTREERGERAVEGS